MQWWQKFLKSLFKKAIYTYRIFSRELKWRLTRVQYMILLAVLSGLVAGLLAVLLKLLVHELQNFLANRYRFHALYLLFPMIGILLTAWVIRRFFHNNMERGLGMVLKSIARRGSYIGSRHNYMHIVTSTLTVGMGGSVGLEAPIVATGASVGSTVGRVHFMDYRERTLLLACGAAAGIAAVFNAPIAGVIFAIEVLLTETIVSYFIPLMIASATGLLCSRILLNESVLFNFVLRETFQYENVIFYVLMGVGAGFLSLYYARAFQRSEHRLQKWNINFVQRAVGAGVLLMALYFLFPPLFGEGYTSIKSLANGVPVALLQNSFFAEYVQGEGWLLLFIALIMFMKPVAAGITLGGGGYGGNFAPSLFTGACWGYLFSSLTNLTGWVKLPVSNFTLVGMASILSGVMYCPLSAIFLIAEITNGYELFVPLMLVSAVSFFIVKHFQSYSIDTINLAQSGKILTLEKEKNISYRVSLDEITDKRIPIEEAERLMKMSTTQINQLFTQSNKPWILVCLHKELYGCIQIQDWINFSSSTSMENNLPIEESSWLTLFQKREIKTVSEKTEVSEVLALMDENPQALWAVVTQGGYPIGLLSKEMILEAYRSVLKDQRDLYG